MDVLSTVILIVAALVMGFGALIGMIRGLKKSVASSVVIAVSLIVAAIITAIVFVPSEETVSSISEFASEFFSDDIFGELGAAAGDVLGYYVLMLVAPFGFTIFFFLTRFVLGIVMRIVVKLIPLMNKLPKVANRLGGAGVGLANGFIVIVVAFMPLLGTMGLIGNFVGVLDGGDGMEALSSVEYSEPEDVYASSDADVSSSEGGLETSEEEIDILAVNDSVVSKIIMTCGGDLLYDGLSSTEYKGERTNLKTELNVISDLVSNVAVFSEDIENYSAEQIVALRNISDDFEKSPIIRDIGASVVAHFGNSWVDISGDAGRVINPVMSEFFKVLATTSADTVCEDVDTLADFLDVLVEDGLFDVINDPDAMFDKLAEGKIIPHITAVADRHERTVGMAAEARKISSRALVAVITVNDEGGADESKIKQDIADALNEYNHIETREEKVDVIADRLVSALADENINISDAMAADIAANVVDDIGDKTEISAEDVDMLLDKYA